MDSMGKAHRIKGFGDFMASLPLSGRGLPAFGVWAFGSPYLQGMGVLNTQILAQSFTGAPSTSLLCLGIKIIFGRDGIHD